MFRGENDKDIKSYLNKSKKTFVRPMKRDVLIKKRGLTEKYILKLHWISQP